MLKKIVSFRGVLTRAINRLKDRLENGKIDPDKELAVAEGERRLALREIKKLEEIRAGRNHIAWSRSVAQGNAEALRLKARKHSGLRVCRHIKIQ
jgi:hypothetical protein